MKLLLDWLSENHVTQAEFAKKLGVDPTSVSQYLNSHSLPSLPIFAKIAKETGLSCEKLLAMFLATPLRKRAARR